MQRSIRQICAIALVSLLAAVVPLARPAFAATFIVNSTADAGDANTGDNLCATAASVCTLRAAIEQANVTAGSDTINFNIPTSDGGYDAGLGVWRIQPATAGLPTLSDASGGTIIDARTQPGGRTVGPNIELDGSGPSAALGFQITTANNAIYGFVINRFDIGGGSIGGQGVWINGENADNNIINENWIGLDAAGIVAAPNNNNGIRILSGDNNTIRGNVIASNGNEPNSAQVLITGSSSGSTPTTLDNIVAGNIIGLNAQGTALPTGTLLNSDGITLGISTAGNIVGGPLPADRNIIAGFTNIDGGNSRAGVTVLASTATGGGVLNTDNVIQGNYIGLNSAGTAAFPNRLGIYLRTDATNLQIIGNTIAGNQEHGILLEATTESISGVTISANRIGVDAVGNARGNTLSGIAMVRRSATDVGVNNISITGNTISANGEYGIRVGIDVQAASLNTNITIAGNFIGTAPGGTSTTTALQNTLSGIVFFSGTNNTIGGPLAADRNVVSGRASQAAIRLSSTNATANTIRNNAIGIAADGSSELVSITAQRATFGILVESGATNNNIGPDNVIGANNTGIQIVGSSGNTIVTNKIGVDSGGVTPRGNTQFGIWILSSPSTTIGGSVVSQRNIIGSNGSHGIFADGTNGSLIIGYNDITNNTQNGIALNTAGSAGALLNDNRITGNTLDGMRITAATGVQIIRTTTASNAGAGINLLSGANASQVAPTLNATLVTGGGGEPRVTGTATGCGAAGCVVEIFSSANRQDGEGPRYLATGTADPSTGAFSIDISSCDRYLTATARNPTTNNTSPFTTPMADTNTGCSAGTPLLGDGTPVTSLALPRSVTASSVITYAHTLTNNGGVGATFTISAASVSQGWNTSVVPTSQFLVAGQSINVVVTVTVPANAIAGVVEVTTVTATAGALSDSKSNYSRVPQTFGVNIEPPINQNFTISPSSVVLTYTHTITNTGTGPDTITINATNSTFTVAPTFSYPDGTQCANLAAGVGCSRRVVATLAPNSGGGSFTVTATGGGSATDSVIDSAFSQSVVPSLTSVAQQDVFPDGTATFVHTLTNTGSQSGTFTPTLTLPNPLDGWSYSFTPSGGFTLGASQTRTITVTATAPGIASSGAISGTIKTAILQVVASSGAQASVNDSARVLLQPQFTFSAASSTPVNAAPLATVVFTHTLQNTSNGDDRYTLVFTPTAGLQNVTVNPASPVSLVRNASTQIIVSGQVRAGTLVGSETIAITAQTTSTPRPAPQTQTDTINVIGAAVPALTVAPAARSGAGGAALRFTYTLTNTGNQAGTFNPPSFTLPTNQSGWGAVIVGAAPPCISGSNLAPGTSCSFDVDVTSPINAFAGTYAVRATVTSVTTPSVPAASALSSVTINANPQLSFTPNRSATTNPGTVISYTHSLTNTGNITDTYNFTTQVPSGWTAPAPSQLLNVPPGAVRTVVVNVTPPIGLLAGSSGVVTTTATAGVVPNPNAQVVDTTTIASVDAATLTPAAQTNGGIAGQPTFFFPTLRNTGSTAIAFDIGVTTAGWTSIVTPTTTAILQPGATLPITLSVQVPANTPINVDNLSSVTVRKNSSATILTTGQYTTTTRLLTSLLSPTTNTRSVLPSTTTVYTHTLTNITGRADTFTLRTIATNGWPVIVSPATVFLEAGASQLIEVRLTVPPARPAGELDYSYVEVQALSDAAINSLGTEITTVQRFAQANLSPSQVRSVVPGQVIDFQHTIVNQGNALDTFQISVDNQAGWPTTITVPAGAQVTLLPGASFPIDIRVTVPTNVAPGTSNAITVRATSAFDGTQGQVTNLAFYPNLEEIPPTFRVALPMVVKP